MWSIRGRGVSEPDAFPVSRGEQGQRAAGVGILESD